MTVDERTRLILWKVAMGLARIETDEANVLCDRFFVGDEDITDFWGTYDNPLTRYNWDTKTVELTERGKKCL